MTCFDWRTRSRTDLQRFVAQATAELQHRIPGLPGFLVFRSSDLSKRRSRCNSWIIASAWTGEYFCWHALYVRPRRPHVWTIEFNDRYPWLYDVEETLLHELAHFVAQRIDHRAPKHGLLWAASCEALMRVMAFDPESRAHATDYLFEVEADERLQTFHKDGIADAAHWHRIRERTGAVLAALLDRPGPVPFDDLLVVIRSAVHRCRPPAPPVEAPKPKRRRARLAKAA